MTIDTAALLTEIKQKSEETQNMIGQLRAAHSSAEAATKSALAAQDTTLVNMQKDLGDKISANAESIQNLQAQVKAIEGLNGAKNELKFFNATIKASASEAVELEKKLFRSFSSSGLSADVGHKLHEMAQKDLSVNDDPSGGFLVTAQTASFIATRIFEGNPLRQVARQETVVRGDALSIPLDDQENAIEWVGETQTRNNTNNATLGEIRIPIAEMHARIPVTLKMIEDAQLDIMAWVRDKSAEKMTRAEGEAFLTGNGITRPKGILSYSNWSGGAYTRNALERVNLRNATALTSDGLIALQNSLAEAYQARANFLMKRTTYGSAMLLKDGQGRYLFNNLPNSNGVFTPGLLGRPVLFCDAMPTVAANALSVAYGDFGAGYCIVDRVGMSLLQDPYSQTGYVQAKMRKRVGGAVIAFDAIKLGVVAA